MEVEALDTADPSVEDVEGDPFLQHHPSSGRSRSLSESNDCTSGGGKSKLYGHRGSTSSSLSWNSSQQLETMYKMRPVLCDVCLRADDGHKVYGHRIVLASAMHYFSSMFIGCTAVGTTTTTTTATDCYASMETDTNGGAGDQPDYWGPSTSSATALTQLAVPSTSTSSAMAVHPPPTTILPSNSFVEQQQFEIVIHNVDGRSLEELIKYCYLGTVAISEETVQSLLAAATMLAATDVIALCADYLRVRLQAANALGIHQFAELVGCLELKEAAFGYILNHFVRISSSSSPNDGTSTSSAVNEEFLALTPDRLAEILSSDHLDTGEAGEPEVLRALNTWMAADPDRRRPFLPQLIKHIRFPKFSQEALICIEAEYPLLRPEPALKDLLIEAMRFHLCKNSTATGHHHFNHHLQFSSQRMFSDSLRLSNLCSGGGDSKDAVINSAVTQNPNQSSSSSSSPSASTSSATATTSSSWTPSLPPNLPQMFDLTNARFRERIPRIRQKCLLVVGGQAPKAIRQCEYLDFGRCKWAELPPGGELPSRRCRSGIAVLNGLIYAIGGFNGQIRVRTVDVYDPKLNSWTQAASLEARRSTLGAAVLNGLLYAVGGFDGTIGLQSAEVYSPLARSWRPIASMSTRRSSVAVAALGGLLYAVGGYDGASRQCLASVEAYCPATDSWRAVADMSQRRSGAGVGVLEGRRLYAIGGHDGPAVRKSVECFDAETGAWSQCADMVVARRNAGVVVREGKLYVVGGDDGQSNLATVEVYDPKANQWTLLPTAMSIGRSYAGVVLVDKTWSQ